MENKKFDWNKRIGNSEKDNSDFVKPAIGWGAFGGTLVVAVAIALIILL